MVDLLVGWAFVVWLFGVVADMFTALDAWIVIA